jgi:hypothetical protein
MKNKLEDLRNHLFAQLERLGDEEKMPGKEELERARAVNDVAKSLIDSARVEVEFLKARNDAPRALAVKSDFITTNALPAPGFGGGDPNP